MKHRFTEKYKGNKVPRLTKFLYPFSTLFRDACYALVGAFLLQYAMTSGVLSSDPATFKAQYGVITIALMVALVWDGINDPIMGFIVEKCHFKSGKYKPWILLGAIGNTLAVLLMFLVRPSFADGTSNGWAYVGCMIGFYFLWDAFFTMNDIGYWAMLPSLSNNDEERAALTSRVTLCSSIGGFAMTAAAMLLPQMISGISTANMYAIFAIVVSILFLASQAAVFFFCQEKEGDDTPKEDDKSSLLDLFKIFGKDKMVRPTIIALFLYYLGAGVLTGGIGLNYFYLSLGYGSGRGGLVATIISVMYVAGMIAAQSTYPLLAKKLSKKKILDLSFIIQIIGFVGFLVCCVPLFGENPIAFSNAPLPEMSSMDFGWAFGGLMFLNYLFPLIFFFGMGWMYMAILVMFQDSIDYHEYVFGERKESLISSWRPLTVKLGSALLRGFQYVIFITAGVYAAYSKISAAESEYNIATSTGGGQAGSAEYQNYITAIAEAEAMVGASNMRVFGILVVLLLTLSITGAYVSLRCFYREKEGQHEEVVQALLARHEQK
ncbi:MAG: MFS transporter [Candidatus Enteromonas sp.]|nr:MFS transporter [Candidatus Enteromonas sp.]